MKALALALTFSTCTPAMAAVPVHVHDGDTLTQAGVMWRLWGVDAPELAQTCSGSPCGRISRDSLERLIGSQAVTCTQVGRSYDRLVGRCFAGSMDLSAAQVEAGQALDYRTYSHGAYARQEARARDAHRGLWGTGFVAPWEWRRTHR